MQKGRQTTKIKFPLKYKVLDATNRIEEIAGKLKRIYGNALSFAAMIVDDALFYIDDISFVKALKERIRINHIDTMILIKKYNIQL